MPPGAAAVWRPAPVLELYPCDSGQLRGDKRAIDQLSVAGIVLNDGRAYSCALQRDRFLTGNVRVQVAVPAGMVTISPSTAEPIAAATSDCDTLFALTVVAPVKREKPKIRVAASKTRAVRRIPGVSSGERCRYALGFFGVHQFPGLFRALNLGCFGSGKTNSWIVHRDEIENKPDRI